MSLKENIKKSIKSFKEQRRKNISRERKIREVAKEAEYKARLKEAEEYGKEKAKLRKENAIKRLKKQYEIRKNPIKALPKINASNSNVFGEGFVSGYAEKEFGFKKANKNKSKLNQNFIWGSGL